MKIFKIIRKHRKKCTALRAVEAGNWTTPWFFKEFYYFRRWHRVGRLICNSVNCKAELRIDVKDIEEGYRNVALPSLSPCPEEPDEDILRAIDKANYGKLLEPINIK